MQTACLFDIDGTLLKVRNKANRTIIQNIIEQFGITDIAVHELDFAGRTDRHIFSSLISKADKSLFNAVKQTYLDSLDRYLTASDVHLYDGVRESLDYLLQTSSETGLLTGNFATAANIKLEKINLAEYFTFGAFGDDYSDRNDLPPVAFETLEKRFGNKFQPSDMIIIGDTPRDIQCAQSFGSISVAVTTGDFSYEELRKYNPDVILESLEHFPDWHSDLIKQN